MRNILSTYLALACLGILAIAPVVIFARVFEMARGPVPIAVAAIRDDSPGLPVESMAKVPATDLPHRLHPPDSTRNPDRFSLRERLEGVAAGLPWLWLAGAPLNLLWLATGLVGVERIRRSGRVIESGEIPLRCRALADSLGIARRVGVAICDRIAAPILIGVIRPLILLPPAAITGWSLDQLEMVLLHELGHLKRWDNLINLMQRVVETTLFFHPVAWWLSGWIRLERELCCDCLVVSRMGRPEAYVEMLVGLAGTHHPDQATVPVMAMADRQITTRIRRILNMKDRSMKLTMPEGVGLVSAVLVGFSPILGTHAAPPKPSGESQDSLRLTLTSGSIRSRHETLSTASLAIRGDSTPGRGLIGSLRRLGARVLGQVLLEGGPSEVVTGSLLHGSGDRQQGGFVEEPARERDRAGHRAAVSIAEAHREDDRRVAGEIGDR